LGDIFFSFLRINITATAGACGAGLFVLFETRVLLGLKIFLPLPPSPPPPLFFERAKHAQSSGTQGYQPEEAGQVALSSQQKF